MRIQRGREGGGGGQGVRSPGKSKVISVSISNKQLDPKEKVVPLLENVGPPSETLTNDSFLCN